MPSNRFARLALLLPAAAVVLAGCATNPVTGTPDLVFQSEAGEIARSKEVHPMLLQQFGGVYDDQQIAQYVNEVGQRAAKASQRPDLQYTFTVLDSEEIILSFLPDWKRVDGNQVSLAFECGSPAEVDEIYARVTEAGFEGEKEPWDAYWGQRYALLGDPDGVRINLYAALE